MIINDKRISEYNATLVSFLYASPSFDTEIQNTGFRIIPMIHSISWNTRKLVLVFEDEENIGEFLSEISEKINIKGVDEYEYIGFLSGNPTIKHLGRNYYEITYPIMCGKYGDWQEILLKELETDIYILGQGEVLPIIEICPSCDIELFQIGSISIKNLKKDKPVIINSIDTLIEENGVNKFSDCDMVKWPVFKKGESAIAINRTDVSVNIKYRPIYL